MIFVTLGTQKFQLNRLLIKIDELIEDRKISEDVYAQIGYSDYIPRNYEYVDFLENMEFVNKVSSADIIITHSGVGSIITALRLKKPVIVFPRLKKYKEHVDDHQLEIAKAFELKNYVWCCSDTEQLISLIKDIDKHKFDTFESDTGHIKDIIIDFINSF